MALFVEGVTAQDAAYVGVRDNPQDRNAREFAEQLWSMFEPYADRHFVSEIRNDFCGRFWEMYLTCALIEHGFRVQCPKPGLDVLIEYNGQKIYVEAIASGPGDETNPDRVSEIGLAFPLGQKIPPQIKSQIDHHTYR